MTTNAGRLTRWLLIAVPVAGIGWAAALSADRAAQRVPPMGQVWVLRDLKGDRVARSQPEAATRGRYIERTQIYAKVSPGLRRRASGEAA